MSSSILSTSGLEASYEAEIVFFCPNCRRDTTFLCVKKHRSVRYERIEFSEEEGSIEIKVWSEILKCGTCNHTKFQSYEIDDYNERVEIQSPIPISEKWHRTPKPEFGNSLSDTEVGRLYVELHDALNKGIFPYCAVIARLLIEIVLKKNLPEEEVLKFGNFIELKNLIKSFGTIHPKLVKISDGLRYIQGIGNITVHALYQPKLIEVEVAIETIEGIINYFYFNKYSEQRFTILNRLSKEAERRR